MEKKVINWLACVLITMYIFIFLLLIVLATQIKGPDCGNIYFFAALWGGIMIGLIPLTLHLTWARILPEKRAQVKLVFKSANEKTIHVRGVGHTRTYLFFTFEFLDGTRLTFPARPNAFNTYMENDIGTLVYKGEGRRCYFVRFERQL